MESLRLLARNFTVCLLLFISLLHSNMNETIHNPDDIAPRPIKRRTYINKMAAIRMPITAKR